MLRNYANLFLYSRLYRRLNIISILIIVIYFYFNLNQDALGFLVQGNAKFLLFTNVYYILMNLRYTFYDSLKKFSICRVGETNYLEGIIKFETIILLAYFFLIYVVGMLILGTNYFIQYIIFVTIYAMILFISHLLHSIAFIYQKNVFLCFLGTYIFLAIYNYYLLDLVYRFIFN